MTYYIALTSFCPSLTSFPPLKFCPTAPISRYDELLPLLNSGSGNTWLLIGQAIFIPTRYRPVNFGVVSSTYFVYLRRYQTLPFDRRFIQQSPLYSLCQDSTDFCDCRLIIFRQMLTFLCTLGNVQRGLGFVRWFLLEWGILEGISYTDGVQVLSVWVNRRYGRNNLVIYMY